MNLGMRKVQGLASEILTGLDAGLDGDFLGGASGKEPSYQYRRNKRHGFDPWVGKIP